MLVYAVTFGGSANNCSQANALALDSSGSTYIAGNTCSSDFPVTTGAFQKTFPSTSGNASGFVAKLNPSGTAFTYATYYGGPGTTNARGIGIDGSRNAYITGSSTSTLPTTAGAFRRTPPAKHCTTSPCTTAFVAKFNSSGSGLVYATFLGGNGVDSGNGIAVQSGFAYVTGSTSSTNFPTTSGVFRRTAPGGGDAFVTKLNLSGGSLAYSTYLGGQASDAGISIAVDSTGHAHVAGFTTSASFPVKSAIDGTYNGNGDAFLVKLSPAAATLIYSTFLGGSNTDEANAVRLDSSGNAYVAGFTRSANFPTTPGAFQRTLAGGTNAWVAKVSP